MADDDIPFERNFDPRPDEVQQVSPLIRRVLAPNPGPFTFTGTCTYIIGRGEVAILDPGPDNPNHIAALVDATKGERVMHIVITHTHRDHAPASRALQQATGAATAGSMSDYMDSLEKLRARAENIYWPGHGGPVREPQRYVRALIHHRHQREAAILTRINAGGRLIAEMVERIYEGLDPRLKGAAALSVLAHLEDLVTRGVVRVDGPATLAARYTPG